MLEIELVYKFFIYCVYLKEKVFSTQREIFSAAYFGKISVQHLDPFEW